jgi:hypothetical protein
MIDYKLEQAKRDVRRNIRFWLDGQMEDPVVINGVGYNAGAESGMLIDSARHLALETGQSTVKITDSNNVSHILTLDECLDVVIGVGQHYQTAFHQKQQWMIAVKNATSIAELPTLT